MKKVFYFLLAPILGFLSLSAVAQQTSGIDTKPSEEQIVLSIEGVKSNADLAAIKGHLDKYDGEITLIEGNILTKTLKLKYAKSYTTEDIMQIINRLGYYTSYIDARGKKAVINSRGVIEFWEVKPGSASDE